VNDKVRALEQQMLALKDEIRQAREEVEAQPVANHVFETEAGEVRLSDLFGDQEDLLVIHNMGKSCSYCTLWADGLDALVPHLARRAAVVLVNGDPVDVQKSHAASRGWRHHRVVRDASGEFTRAVGMLTEDGWMPGLSGFRKDASGVKMTGQTYFGPGDDFCGVWPAFELLEGGAKGWEPT